LYVGGLKPETDAAWLRELFAPYGAVREARVARRDSTGECRGFGFVTFSADAPALTAKAELDGSVRGGRRLRVDLAR
jgi:cold-inducible RNA-binding protein